MMREHRLKYNDDNCVQVQLSLGGVPTAWSKTPSFDKKERPVECLNWKREGQMVQLVSADKKNIFSQRWMC